MSIDWAFSRSQRSPLRRWVTTLANACNGGKFLRFLGKGLVLCDEADHPLSIAAICFLSLAKRLRVKRCNFII